jgi:hypothetical protein
VAVQAAPAVAVAAIFVWLGMVLAVSFIETPLRFRAPGVTLHIGLGIGRLVFRTLNMCELVLTAAVVVVTPLVQVFVVRRQLTRRSDVVLAGNDGPRSRAHWVYVGLETVKVIALIITGVWQLAT